MVATALGRGHQLIVILAGAEFNSELLKARRKALPLKEPAPTASEETKAA